MTINCLEVIELIKKEWDQFNVEVRDADENNATIIIRISAEKYYDDGIVAVCTFSGTGYFDMDLIFDTIDKSFKNLALVNDFNVAGFPFSAYIDTHEDGYYLHIHFVNCIFVGDSSEMEASFSYCLGRLLDDDVYEKLKPLTNITK